MEDENYEIPFQKTCLFTLQNFNQTNPSEFPLLEPVTSPVPQESLKNKEKGKIWLQRERERERKLTNCSSHKAATAYHCYYKKTTFCKIVWRALSMWRCQCFMCRRTFGVSACLNRHFTGIL